MICCIATMITVIAKCCWKIKWCNCNFYIIWFSWALTIFIFITHTNWTIVIKWSFIKIHTNYIHLSNCTIIFTIYWAWSIRHWTYFSIAKCNTLQCCWWIICDSADYTTTLEFWWLICTLYCNIVHNYSNTI